MDYNRKDCLPDFTIRKIKKILKECNINIKVKKIININKKIYSVRVELKGLIGVGANGKGISKQYALASAYSELLERLQSGNLLSREFLNKNTKNEFSEVKIIKYEDFIKKFKEYSLLNQKNVIKLTKNSEEYRTYEKFYDILNQEYIDLPSRLINLLTHSNGLCAGNSKYEALVQGICEIFERFCYKEILFEEIDLPIIEYNEEDIKNVKQQLDQINKMGYIYEIRDCSLKGKFPVVGLIIYAKSREKYLFSIGSDPDFEVALQRCITEAFQGISGRTVNNKFKQMENGYNDKKTKFKDEFVKVNWLKCYTSNNGIHPKNFFVSKNKIKIADLPFKKVKSNNEAYNFVVDIIKNNNYELYIKDYSFLGFDTYKVYIPILSEIDELSDVKLEVMSNYNMLKEKYCNFNNFEKEDDLKFKSILKMVCNSIEFTEFIHPDNLFRTNGYIISDFVNLNYFYLLLIYLVMYKKYNELNELLVKRLKTNILSDYEKEYLECVCEKIKGDNSYKKYNKHIVKDVEQLLENTENYLNKLYLPCCPNCRKCKVKKCTYRNWNKINEILKLKSDEYYKT